MVPGSMRHGAILKEPLPRRPRVVRPVLVDSQHLFRGDPDAQVIWINGPESTTMQQKASQDRGFRV